MTSRRWTEIWFKCRCMAQEAVVQVRERGPQEDVSEFMVRVQEALTVRHRELSLLCMSTTMEYAKVPVEGDVIGGAKGGTA